MEKRILELAIETLQTRKAAIENEIAGLRSAMREGREPGALQPEGARRSQSEAMKAYWARKKAEAAGPAHKKSRVKKPRFSEATRKAISERMKAYWAERKASQRQSCKKATMKQLMQ
jgi:hypothetical protein